MRSLTLNIVVVSIIDMTSVVDGIPKGIRRRIPRTQRCWTRQPKDCEGALRRHPAVAVGGRCKLRRYGGRNLHAPAGRRFGERSESRLCMGGSNECCSVTIWSAPHRNPLCPMPDTARADTH